MTKTTRIHVQMMSLIYPQRCMVSRKAKAKSENRPQLVDHTAAILREELTMKIAGITRRRATHSAASITMDLRHGRHDERWRRTSDPIPI